ncbi:unnamed protein product [Nippostrongylus brasiliensis]|uniref:COMM domain-containing protein n=1 Tax=Nippostrongylus brasiliensis TaxID=27835 RepID=A0A0N4YGY6_NIPBR|nr:unnamed protein product [Nippostrongylus brasiliensis]
MHFQFLGGQDCPDWLLAQIGDFSNVSTVKFKGLCQLSIEFLLRKNVSDDQVKRFVSEHIDTVAVRRFLYSISFMMKNAASYNCASDDFETECTHLGLPAEHSKVLARVYSASIDILRETVKNSIPKEAAMESVVVSESGSAATLKYAKKGEETVCDLTVGQLNSLRRDMALVQKMIEENFKS